MAVKINTLELENVKRIKAVKLEPTKNGLTVIGGKNRQGKTSVLDSIAWALGGEKFRPSQPQREGSMIEPHLKITLDNGIVVERKGKNGSLKVLDPHGQKGSQQLLNSFVEQFALDLPKFLNQTNKEKASTLLRIIGVGAQLSKLELEETQVYNKRHAIGQIADQKKKYAKEMPVYDGVPTEPLSVSDLIKRQQDILARNGDNQRKREYKAMYDKELSEAKKALEQAELSFKQAQTRLEQAQANVTIASKSVENLVDENTAELERDIAQIETINEKVRANLDRQKAEIDAEEYVQQYSNLTADIDRIRKAKRDLLTNADLPLDGLTVENGELLYKGYKWDNMSSSDQLIVATSIVRKLNPNCGFVLLDKLEQMDLDTLNNFGQWLEKEGLQAIATRVSTGDECSIIIEDGMAVGNELPQAEIQPQNEDRPKWKAGVF